MKYTLLTTLTLATPLMATPSIVANQRITLGNAGAGEIVSVLDGATPTLAVTNNPVGGVQLFEKSGGAFSLANTVDFGTYFNNNAIGGFTFDEVSSVSLDPLGRGFGVAALINGNVDGNGNEGEGLIGIFNYQTGSVIGTLSAGYHPDQIGFSKNGNYISVANEGEMGSDGLLDNEGSLSLYDLSGVTGIGNVLTEAVGGTYDFSDSNTSAGFKSAVAGVRSHDLAGGTYREYLEPEYTTFSSNNSKVFVSLQENNAIATFDVASETWESVTDLGVHLIDIDPSDKDGVADTSTLVYGAPMPDTIASFVKKGTTYVVTANEGDARGDDLDTVELGDNPYTSIPKDPLNNNYELDSDNVGGIDRLGLVDNLSDTNGDDIAERIVSYGTRDIAIWEVSDIDGTLTRVSSVDMEEYVLGEDPTRHNANDGGDPGEFDKRSDNKGPEPEALAVHVSASGDVYILAANERQNGLVLIEATDPTNPEAIAYLNDQSEGLLSPESIQLVEIDGVLTAVVGYEAFDDKPGSIGIYNFTSINAATVPEPSSSALLILSGSALLFRRKRK